MGVSLGRAAPAPWRSTPGRNPGGCVAVEGDIEVEKSRMEMRGRTRIRIRIAARVTVGGRVRVRVGGRARTQSSDLPIGTFLLRATAQPWATRPPWATVPDRLPHFIPLATIYLYATLSLYL